MHAEVLARCLNVCVWGGGGGRVACTAHALIANAAFAPDAWCFRAHEALVATLATLADAGIASQPPQQQYQSLRQRFGQQLQQEQQPTPAFVQANVRAGPIQQGASSGSEPGSPAARAPAHCKITAGASGPACPGSK